MCDTPLDFAAIDANFDIPNTVHALYGVSAVGANRADRFELHGEPNRLAAAAGEGLAQLHRLPIEPRLADQAGDGFETALELIEQRLASRLIDPEALPDPYCRYEATRLVELARSAPQGRPDIGWCHRCPTLDQFMVANSAFVGFVGPSRAGVGDRHLDVAILQLDIARLIGAQGVITFHEAYGMGVDIVQLDRCLLLAHLSGFGA